MSSPTPHRFKNPVWDIGDVLGWLIDREPAQFGRIATESDLRSALRRATWYTSRPWPRLERDPNAPTNLLHALQRGDLVASDPDKRGNDKSLSRDYWQAEDQRDIRAAIGRRLKFWREDVLRLWPAFDDGKPTGTSTAISTIAAETRCREWLAKLMCSGKPTMSRPKYQEEAVRLFGVGSRGFLRAWGNAITDTGNEDWKKPGRKS